MIIYLLKADLDGTLRSRDTSIGIAVTDEEQAKNFVKNSHWGYSRSYDVIHIVEDITKTIYLGD